jgi:hypothetical protein
MIIVSIITVAECMMNLIGAREEAILTGTATVRGKSETGFIAITGTEPASPVRRSEARLLQ